MRYRYKPTGAVIEIASELHSPHWEQLGAKPPAEKLDAPKKAGKKAVKQDGELR